MVIFKQLFFNIECHNVLCIYYLHKFYTFAQTNSMKIGNKLRGLRNEKGLSTLDIAERLDISESTYRRFESDKSFPDVFTLDKISKIYNKRFTDILPEEFTVSQNNNEIAIVQNYATITLSDKLIEQYEARIKNLEEQIVFWRKAAEK